MDEPKKNNGYQELKVLVQRIDKGNPKKEDLALLHKEFDRMPQLYRNVGNISKQVFESVIGDANKSIVFGESVERYAEEMKQELGYQSSTFIEKMLIDEVVMRWLRLSVMDSAHRNITSQSHRREEGMYIEKRLHLAQKNYLRASETLVKVRKMIAQTQAKGAEMVKNLLTADKISAS